MGKIRAVRTSAAALIQHQSQTYWQTLSWKSYTKFLFAIFLIFSCIGYLNDIMTGGQFSGWQLAGNVALSGFVAIAWVFSFTHNLKILPFAIALFIGSLFYTDIWSSVPASHEPRLRLKLDSIGIIVHLILGYIFLIKFIMTEGSQHIRLRTEMKLAKDLHDILVPVIQFRNADYEVYGHAIPTDEVGGDLVDLNESENILTCYIADVSGHGVAAGLLMGMFKTAVHSYLQSSLSIADILTRSNNVLNRLKKRSMFITCAFIRFFSDNTAEYSIAGHLPILHFNAGEAKINQLHLKQIPVTAKQDYAYDSKRVSINAGDLLVLLTDGFIEVDNSEDQEFGMGRIEKLLYENSSAPLDSIFSKIVSGSRNYGPQRDDQTMLLIRRL